MNRIIFLDIDGVLNNEHSFNRWQSLKDKGFLADGLNVSDCIDPACVNNLNTILYNTDAKIVLSSSWRLFNTVDWVQNHLKSFGFLGTIIDATPDLTVKSEKSNIVVSQPRGKEISQWIQDNEFDGDFVIIDDLEDVRPFTKRLVKTDISTGLTETHVDEVLNLFNK